MSLIANAKAKLATGNVTEAFKNEEGAIDLASIMVGIIVIGLIGGVIAATVFAVIPWAQDNAAKQQLDSVASAESAFVGLSTQGTNAHFGDGTATAGVGLADPANKLFDATSAGVKIAVQGGGNTAHYVAADKSASGKVFYISDTKTQPTVADGAGTDVAASVFVGQTSIAGGTVINGVTWGVGGTTPTNVNLTGASF